MRLLLWERSRTIQLRRRLECQVIYVGAAIEKPVSRPLNSKLISIVF